MDRRTNLTKRERFESVRRDVAARLGRACAHLRDFELRDLTARIARLQLRYESVTAVPDRARNPR